MVPPFTLPKNETENETDTDNKYTELNGNLCCHLSLCIMSTFTLFYIGNFSSVSVLVLVSGAVNTLSHYIEAIHVAEKLLVVVLLFYALLVQSTVPFFSKFQLQEQ